MQVSSAYGDFVPTPPWFCPGTRWWTYFHQTPVLSCATLQPCRRLCIDMGIGVYEDSVRVSD